MKNSTISHIIIALIVSAGLLQAQKSEVRNVDDFHGVSVSASVDAELIKGSTDKVTIIVENYDLADVETEVKNGILKVNMKGKGWGSGSWKKRKVKAEIVYSGELDHISVGASADLIAKDVIKSKELEVNVSSSGDASMEVDVEELRANVSSSGDLNIKGRATHAHVVASSSADFEGGKLETDEAVLTASSSANHHGFQNGLKDFCFSNPFHGVGECVMLEIIKLGGKILWSTNAMS